MKKFFGEFKEFIDRGNAMDLAVAVVIGAAFTAIVNSVVNDLVMPIVSALTGGVDFTQLQLVIPLGAGQASIKYGNFISAIVLFTLIAFIVFCFVKALNKMKSLGKKGTDEEELVCVFCKEPLRQGATRCPHCTAELPEAAGAYLSNNPGTTNL